MLFGLLGGPAWRWRLGAAPTAQQLSAAAVALRCRRSADRSAVLAHLAAVLDPFTAGGKERVAAVAAALCSTDVLDAVAGAVHPDAGPSEELIEAAATFAARLAAASPAAAAALGDSAVVGSLSALLAAPSRAVSPDAKLEVLACFRATASRAHVREAMLAAKAPEAVVSCVRAATRKSDWPLAGEAAWALELMAGMSRRLASAFGEAEGVEACLGLLEASRRQQPALRELPRDEDAAEAATSALHALLVLLTDSRRNRVRLQRAGGASELAAAFQDERLGWEAREQAAGLLQDLAAALGQDGAAADLAPPTDTPASSSAHAGRSAAAAAAAAAAGTEQQQEGEWRRTLLPSLVAVLHQRRGQHLQESKEAAAGVLAKFAANGPRFAAAASEAGALPPLVQLLLVGSQLAGGERRTAIAALQALEQLVGDAGCQEQLLGPCTSGAGSLDLLGLLRRLLADATAPEFSLTAFPSSLADPFPAGASAGAASPGGSPGGAGLFGRGGEQIVLAGWHAAAVTARLCSSNGGGGGGGGAVAVQQAQRLQDAAVARGLLPLLARFVEARLPLAGAEQMAAIQCEVAGLLRSLSMRSAHHAALRACPGLLLRLRALVQPGAAGWVDFKAAAKKTLQNLGELPDTDRPLLTYTPQQLGALLESQGIEASRFLERGVTGAEFVRLTDSDLRSLTLAGQQGRVLRVLRAHEAFAEIDGCGQRSGSVGLAKLAAYLSNRGFRQAEVVPLAESLLGLMDGDRDDAASFPDFLQAFDEFLARTMADVQPPSKRRRTDSRLD